MITGREWLTHRGSVGRAIRGSRFGPEVTADALDAHLATLLAPYKRPRAYELTRFPLRDEAGKVRRSALRARRLSAGAAS